MGLKILNPLLKTVAKKVYVTPKIEVRTLESLGLKMEQLTGDIAKFSETILKRPSAEKLTAMIEEQGLAKNRFLQSYGKEMRFFAKVDSAYITENNSLFLEELIKRFPLKEGDKTNVEVQRLMLYLQDINHSKIPNKKEFLDDFLKEVEKIDKLLDNNEVQLFTDNTVPQMYTKKAILQAKYNNPERYQDIMNLYKLHKEGKAPKYLLQTLFPESTFHHLPKSDIQKLLRGENYYPQLENLSESLVSKLETGEAFSVGKDMFVKTANGYEKLKIDAKTYELLFPPIERYALAQGPFGNCHLMAAIDSIIKNPEGRIEIYKMFESIEGSGIKCTIAGYKDSGIVYHFDDFAKLNGENNLKGSLGHKIVEYTYAKNYYEECISGPFGWRTKEMTNGDPIKIFDIGGDYENVSDHINYLIGKKSKTIMRKTEENFDDRVITNIKKEQKGISVANCLTRNQNKGIYNAHFYNADLESCTTINPWNTLEEIHYNPFNLSDITYTI